MRVLVCGGRDYDSNKACAWLQEHAIRRIESVMRLKDVRIAAVIHGAARGADEGGRLWGVSLGTDVLGFPADWETHGRAAGPIRNQQMIELGKPDLVIAFPGGRGTANMVRQAEAACIPVIRVEDTAEGQT